MTYIPPREANPQPTGQPIEVDLVFNVTSCGTCDFFWPAAPGHQIYGPYPSFDITMTPPPPKDPPASTPAFVWAQGTTGPAAYPTPGLLDGCRKAPIMTVGINPNLTAFAPGRAGTSWCYPSFASDASADLFTKYAYYFRYRSVFQERFDFDWVQQFLLPLPRIVAHKDGSVVSALRPTDAPSYELHVRYDGDSVDTIYRLEHELGTPRWVVLFDSHGATSAFKAGDTIAAKLDVPAGQAVRVFREPVGYYEQFVPVMEAFQSTLRESGHQDAVLQMGEDVCQMDMVACASPHWNQFFLGDSDESVQTIVDNCVAKNAYVMKQLVQTRPAVLYLVGESAYDMFHGAFGALLQRDVPLSTDPVDGAFTLLTETTDPQHPCNLKFDTVVGGAPYSLTTRVVVTPHFSYSSNFTPQIRLSPEAWADLQRDDPACAAALNDPPKIVPQLPIKPTDYAAFLITEDAASVLADLQQRFPLSGAQLAAAYYDPHAMMATVLDDLYVSGTLTYGAVPGGALEALGRTEGSCHFCVNEKWTFAGECRYDKTSETAPPAGYLEQVAAQMVASGRPPAPLP
ncbi:MAG TPA: hypothetical protein VFB78_09205 [Acidimicrobiales bacterium]|nr:hypothetical protein [Acidimicrobiales bacterium]